MGLPRIELLVTDLDNTLYDWVTFFSTAFYEMVPVACRLLDVDEESLLDEFRDVHRRHHDSEPPYGLLETRSALRCHGHLPVAEQKAALDEAFHTFDRARKRALRLYPGVRETLARVAASGVPIVAYTEATMVNACFRLDALGISGLFAALYALPGSGDACVDPDRCGSPSLVVRAFSANQRKPDPSVLRWISSDFAVAPERMLHVGDSLVGDVGAAKEMGAYAAWARYGTVYDPVHWQCLVRITHWTDEDVRRAEAARHHHQGTRPDAVLSEFGDLLSMFAFG